MDIKQKEEKLESDLNQHLISVGMKQQHRSFLIYACSLAVQAHFIDSDFLYLKMQDFKLKD
jgi:hypothetical protein